MDAGRRNCLRTADGSAMKPRNLIRSVIVVTLLASLSACGSEGGDTPAADEGGRDLLVVTTATLGSENFLHPWTDVSASQALQPMYETLLERNPDGTVKQETGRLAETWSHNEDYTEYTFNLRQGVMFHGDYGEFTSADVQFSYELYTREDSKGATASTFRSTVATLETPDPYTVVFTMQQPFASFADLLTENVFILGMSSKAYYDEVGEEQMSREPIATGPYRFVGYEQGQSVSYEAVEDHWRQTPAIKDLRIEIVAEEATRLAGLRSGDIDISTISYDSVEPAEQDGVQIISIPDASQPVVHLMGQYLSPAYDPAARPAWADEDPEIALKVRTALSHAINRQEILDAVMAGRGSLQGACAPSFFPTNPGADPTCEPDSYDPDQAIELLAEAGFSEPADLEVEVNLARHPNSPYGADVLAAVAQQWQNLGITVTTTLSDWAANTDASIARQATYAVAYSQPSYFDAAALLAVFSRSTDVLSFTGESTELDTLITTALAAYEAEEVVSTREELYDFLAEGRYSLPIAYGDLTFGANPDLEWSPLVGAGGVHHFEYMSYGD